MERVGVLINKLQEQLLQNADVEYMLVTTQMLQSELLLQAKKVDENKKVSVMVSGAIPVSRPAYPMEPVGDLYKPVPKPESEPEPVAEPMPEPEAPMPEAPPVPTPKPEPEPIPHYTEYKPWQAIFNKKEEKANPWSLETVTEAPTLTQQEKIVYELNDVMVEEGSKVTSLNDRLKQQNKPEMSSFLQESPIRDLKKAISINDRHRFIHELFRDDETMYERSIKTINSFNIFAEAEYWIQRELKLKLGWDNNLELVKIFDQLVKRRFS